METAVNCMTLFNLNSNLYPTSVVVLKIFVEMTAVCADTSASHTIAGLDFLNAAGIVLDVQGGKWHFSGNPRKQYKFFKKTLEDITLRAFKLQEDEGDHPPTATSPYKMNPVKKEVLRVQIEELLRQNVMEEKLNSVMKVDTYPLSRIDDLLNEATPTSYMSTIDLQSGYLQVKVSDVDQDKAKLLSFVLLRLNAIYVCPSA
ncbi:transposon Ty3-I Gag-Pol polyprotein [Trichonephila clavipes]|nr:transposon Ty3-I Gag-Pol polyprotein [Trichonephila clavipes]